MTAPAVASVTLPRRVESVRDASAFIVRTARGWRIPAAESPLFEVAVVEALNNTLEHTGGDGAGAIVCELELDPSVEGETRILKVRVLDDAAAAPPGALGLPAGAIPWARAEMADAKVWEQVPTSGYGLYLIREVFADLQPVTRDGRHGVELRLRC